MCNFPKYMSRTLAFKGCLQANSPFDSWPLVFEKIFRIFMRFVLLYVGARIDFAGAEAFEWLEAKIFAWLEAGLPVFQALSLSNLLFVLKARKSEAATPLQEREPGSTTGVALQEPDFDVIYLVYLIG